jgi:hypothetical protein
MALENAGETLDPHISQKLHECPGFALENGNVLVLFKEYFHVWI